MHIVIMHDNPSDSPLVRKNNGEEGWVKGGTEWLIGGHAAHCQENSAGLSSVKSQSLKQYAPNDHSTHTHARVGHRTVQTVSVRLELCYQSCLQVLQRKLQRKPGPDANTRNNTTAVRTNDQSNFSGSIRTDIREQTFENSHSRR